MPDDQRLRTDTLYEQDFYAWARTQAQALLALRERAGPGAIEALDLENLAEEIDALARSDRRQAKSRIEIIIEHLLKFEHGLQSEPRRGWEVTVRRERRDLESLLDESPSLRREVPALIERARLAGVERAMDALGRHDRPGVDSMGPHSADHYGEPEILGDWFPEPPAA